MRIEEAVHVRTVIEDLPLKKGLTILNIGSSTKIFRESLQPHVSRELIQPLVEAGHRVIHCDMKADEGVDLVGDVLDQNFRQELAAFEPDVIMCCNLLEHLTDPRTFAHACSEILGKGGYLIATVPYSYPYHKDPIDTGLRPTPHEIARLFTGMEIVGGTIVTSTSYWQDATAKKGGRKDMLRDLVKTALPFYSPQGWRARAHRFMWLWRPYKISVAVLRKSAADN